MSKNEYDPITFFIVFQAVIYVRTLSHFFSRSLSPFPRP